MDKYFEILFLDEAFEFLSGLERKQYEKILYNIRKSQVELDPELFKKLSDDIWEFRTLYQGLQYRLLAFWDKTSTINTLVVSTHGFVKKRSKVPYNESKKQEKIKAYTLDQVQDKLIGKIGTPERDIFEYELQMDLIGKAIKQTRQERHLTQEELGKLIGVQKAQISRLENNASNVTMDTLIKVFTALNAKIKLQVELPNLNISVGK